MSYESTNHTFLYHAYALALGGWVRDKDHNFLPIKSIASSVLSITGGYGSSSVHDLNIGLQRKYPFGEGGPGDFNIYVGHAYTEVRGVEDTEDQPRVYKTTVRSVLDDVRINDVFSVEHAEAILMSTHERPDPDGNAPEGKVVVGESNMSGVRVDGKRAKLTKRGYVDNEPTFGGLQAAIKDRQKELAMAGKGGDADSWLDDLSDWNDPEAVPKDKDLQYAYDIAKMNRKTERNLRFSVFKRIELPEIPGVKTFNTSVFIEGFGRIFFGEVIASHGMKQVTMFRMDLGCDNCGGVGGSGGSTNGGPTP